MEERKNFLSILEEIKRMILEDETRGNILEYLNNRIDDLSKNTSSYDRASNYINDLISNLK